MEGLINEIKHGNLEGKNSLRPINNDLDSPLKIENRDYLENVNHNQDGSWSNDVELSPEELDKPLFENNGLSPEQKERIKEETGWSDKIVDHIKSADEASVYIEANLKENNGNLERSDIDWNAPIPQNRIDRMRSLYGDEVADKWAGKTNLDLIKEGKAPYGPDGERINLHHIGQKSDSPLAELTNTEHKKNDGILHNKNKTSEIGREVFKYERQRYWISRYEALQTK